MKSWNEILDELSKSEPNAKISILKTDIISPKEAGAIKSIGLPYGQISDWRFKPEKNCTGLHIHEYENEWVAHLDQVHPSCSVINHLRYDAPGTFLAITSTSGLVLGQVFKNKPLPGVLIGFFGGLLMVMKKRTRP